MVLDFSETQRNKKRRIYSRIVIPLASHFQNRGVMFSASERKK